MPFRGQFATILAKQSSFPCLCIEWLNAIGVSSCRCSLASESLGPNPFMTLKYVSQLAVRRMMASSDRKFCAWIQWKFPTCLKWCCRKKVPCFYTSLQDYSSTRRPVLGSHGFGVFLCLPNSAWTVGNLAEMFGRLCNMAEHPNPSQTNPGLRAYSSPCTEMAKKECKFC